MESPARTGKEEVTTTASEPMRSTVFSSSWDPAGFLAPSRPQSPSNMMNGSVMSSRAVFYLMLQTSWVVTKTGMPV